MTTWPDPLGPCRHCPRARRCEACCANRLLEVATYQTPVGGTRRRWAPGPERSSESGAHCEHLGIDLDQMAALLHGEGDGNGWG